MKLEMKKTAILFAFLGASAALVGCAATDTTESAVEQSQLPVDLGEVDLTSEDVTLEIEESQTNEDTPVSNESEAGSVHPDSEVSSSSTDEAKPEKAGVADGSRVAGSAESYSGEPVVASPIGTQTEE